MIINKSGITIRLSVKDVRIMGRATQGVRLINLEKRNDSIGSVCKVISESEEENVVELENEDDDNGVILTDLPIDDSQIDEDSLIDDEDSNEDDSIDEENIEE